MSNCQGDSQRPPFRTAQRSGVCVLCPGLATSSPTRSIISSIGLDRNPENATPIRTRAVHGANVVRPLCLRCAARGPRPRGQHPPARLGSPLFFCSCCLLAFPKVASVPPPPRSRKSPSPLLGLRLSCSRSPARARAHSHHGLSFLPCTLPQGLHGTIRTPWSSRMHVRVHEYVLIVPLCALMRAHTSHNHLHRALLSGTTCKHNLYPSRSALEP